MAPARTAGVGRHQAGAVPQLRQDRCAPGGPPRARLRPPRALTAPAPEIAQPAHERVVDTAEREPRWWRERDGGGELKASYLRVMHAARRTTGA